MPAHQKRIKRLAATRAADNISHQYAAPFMPKADHDSKLGNTATQYDKVDRAFKPGGHVRRSTSDQKPDISKIEPTPEAGPSRQAIGVGKGPRMRANHGIGRSMAKAHDGTPGLGELMAQYLAASDDDPAGQGPSRQAPIADRFVGKRAEHSTPSSDRTEEAVYQPIARSHKRKAPPVTPSNAQSTSTSLPPPPPSKKPRRERASSPLTPRSSDQNNEDEQPFFPARSSPLFPPAPLPAPFLSRAVPRSTALRDPPPVPSSMRWWAELSPQPVSSPLSDARSESAPDSLLGFLAQRPIVQEDRRSRASSDSLSSMRWSPRSPVARARANTPGRGNGSPARPVIPAPVPPIIPPAPAESRFKPRSQAFQGFNATGNDAEARVKVENEKNAGKEETWQELQ